MARRQQGTLPGTSTRARRGRTETALEDTFRQWNATEHLTGPAYYGLRQALRQQAKAVDELHTTGKPEQAARAAAVLAGQLWDMRPTHTASRFDEFVQSLTAAGT